MPADEGHPLPRVQRQARVAVGQHGDALGGEPGQLLAAPGTVGRRQVGRVVARLAQGAGPVGETQQPAQVLVDDWLTDLAGLDGGDEGVAPGAVGAGHDEVEPAVGGRGHGTGGEPVGHDQSLVPPFALHDLVVHVLLLGGGDAVDVVVGGHHRPRVGFADRDLERQQVQLAERGLVDDTVHGVAVGLGLVGDQVLEAGADAAVLHPAHAGSCEAAGEQRVLGVRLEEPPAERRAVQVDGRAEHHVDLLGHRLLGEQPADLVGGVLAPGGGEQGGVREQRDGPAAAEFQAAHTGGAVGEPQFPEPDRVAGREGEGGGAGQQGDLAGQVKGADQVGVVVGHGGHGGHGTFLTGMMASAPRKVRTAAVTYSRS